MNDKIISTEKFRRANFWVCVSVAIVVLYAIAREYWGFANEANFAIWMFFLAVLATIIANICGKKVAQPDLISRERFILLVVGLPSVIIAPDTFTFSDSGIQETDYVEMIYIHVWFACLNFILSWAAIRNVYLSGPKTEEIVTMKWFFCIIMMFLSVGAFFVFWYYEFKPMFFLIIGFMNMLIAIGMIDPFLFKRNLNKMLGKV